jgi:ferrous iron transport protein B
MSDEAEEQGLEYDTEQLEKLLGMRIVRTSGASGEGIETMKRMMGQIAYASEGQPHPKPTPYGVAEDAAVREMVAALEASSCNQDVEPKSYLAEKLLEGDQDICSRYASRGEAGQGLLQLAKTLRSKLVERDSLPVAILFADRRYGYISGLVRETLLANRRERLKWTDRIDSVATNRWLGIPLFLVAMYLVFFVTFTLGDPIVGWTEDLFGWISSKLGELLADSPQLCSLVQDGVIGGVGGVLSFVPTILILFFFIALLEESGYMARAAFIMDRLMHKMGLHGKSFIPMLIGFGCSVPAIMATRSIESRRDRLATMFVLPLMSCGARLPIYILFISALFPQHYQAEILWCIYLVGIILAVFTARILKSTLFKGDDEVFIMELPPYRMPAARNLLMVMWQRALMYLKKASTFILFASVILWFLNTYPREEEVSADHAALQASVETPHESSSYSAQIGRFFEPVTKWAGLDWKTNSALLGAFAAKEVFVTQLGILYSVPQDELESDEAPSLRHQIQRNYSPLQGLCIMLICLIAMPCVATVSVMRKESGSWLFTVSNVLFLDLLGLIVAILAFQIGSLF